MNSYSNVQEAQRLLMNHADADYAQKCRIFMNALPGGYAENDQFIGVNVPTIRSIEKSLSPWLLDDISELLYSDCHDMRFMGLVALCRRKMSTIERLHFYERHLFAINNWNLVDVSAKLVVGDYLYTLSNSERRDYLLHLVTSDNIWARRIAVVGTLGLVKRSQLQTSLYVCEQLLDDHEDLIHKAVGWVLREVGKKDLDQLLQFLDRHVARMPRTTLRYAIEKLTPEQRHMYLKR